MALNHLLWSCDRSPDASRSNWRLLSPASTFIISLFFLPFTSAVVPLSISNDLLDDKLCSCFGHSVNWYHALLDSGWTRSSSITRLSRPSLQLARLTSCLDGTLYSHTLPTVSSIYHVPFEGPSYGLCLYELSCLRVDKCWEPKP